MRSDLPVTKLAENVYLLNEFDGTNCYLVVGRSEEHTSELQSPEAIS